jgi:hypothetical protein
MISPESLGFEAFSFLVAVDVIARLGGSDAWPALDESGWLAGWLWEML